MTTLLPDPAQEIAAIPAGGIWQGTGETYLTAGVEVTQPVTILGNGSTFYNPAVSPTVGVGLKPLIRVKDTHDVIVEGLTLEGALTPGTGRETRWMVGEAGVEVLSSAHVTLQDINVENVWGDGLTLGFQPRQAASTDITVSNYTIAGTGGIRQGVTIAYVDGATLDNLTVSSGAGIDFESDIENIGAANVTITNYSGTGGIRMIEALQGPITINNPRFTGNLTMINAAAASGQTVTVNGGHLFIKRNYTGIPPAGIWVKVDFTNFPGPSPANLKLVNVAVDRSPGVLPIETGAWLVEGGGQLTLEGCCIADPQGTHDAASTVTIT